MKDFIKGLKEGQKSFGESIGVIINSILLSLAYVFGIGLTSLIAKIIGKRFLDLRLEKKQTYWEELNLEKKKISTYYKQF